MNSHRHDIAVAIAIAVRWRCRLTATREVEAAITTTMSCQPTKPTGLNNDAEKRFLNVPEQPTTGHARF